jgi:phosphopantothenoylcysteine synthetase/decarboxylase
VHKRRLRVVKWLSTTPVVGVCALCNREFRVAMLAMKRTADAQASLQEQFDRHNCGPLVSSQAADVFVRRQPDEEDADDEDEDKKKEEDDDEDDDEDDETDDGYSE